MLGVDAQQLESVEDQLLAFSGTKNKRIYIMNSIVWLVGAVVIVIAIISFLGLG